MPSNLSNESRKKQRTTNTKMSFEKGFITNINDRPTNTSAASVSRSPSPSLEEGDHHQQPITQQENNTKQRRPSLLKITSSRMKSTGLLRSFSFKKQSSNVRDYDDGLDADNYKNPAIPAFSTHPIYSNLPGAEEGRTKPNLSAHHVNHLAGLAKSTTAALSAVDVAKMVAEGYDSKEDEDEDDFDLNGLHGSTLDSTGLGMNTSKHGSTAPSVDSKSLDDSEESCSKVLDTKTLLKSLGPNPTEESLALIAATRAREYLEECFSAEISMLDREKLNRVPQYSKSELVIATYLGKGSFSDAFEVIATVKEDPLGILVGIVAEDSKDLDMKLKALESKFGDTSVNGGGGEEEEFKPTRAQRNGSMDLAPPSNCRVTSRRRNTMTSSICVGTIARSNPVPRERKVTLAMKCLRPQIRSDAEQFLIGVEDLIHETIMLSSLSHPNIIEIHGRAGGSVSNSFKLSDGYFILLDRLKDTLDSRMDRWAKSNAGGGKLPPSLSQVKVACAIADALSYLHQHDIVFRDLKPVGIDYCLLYDWTCEYHREALFTLHFSLCSLCDN